MFDRNTTTHGDRRKVPVQIRLVDGTLTGAQLLMAQGARLIDVLNRSEPFVEIELADGTALVLSKQAIREVIPVTLAKVDQLTRARNGSFDPLEVLGLQAGASENEIRAAFVARVKQYHPDRFASLSLPGEVEEYARCMLQRINTAYQLLAPREAVA